MKIWLRWNNNIKRIQSIYIKKLDMINLNLNSRNKDKLIFVK